MEKEITEVYCGNGRGKTTLAIGQALRASSQGKSVIIIQFLKGNERRELDFLEELDQPDLQGLLSPVYEAIQFLPCSLPEQLYKLLFLHLLPQNDLLCLRNPLQIRLLKSPDT